MNVGCEGKIEENKEERNTPSSGPWENLQNGRPLPLSDGQGAPWKAQGELTSGPFDHNPKGRKTDHRKNPCPKTAIHSLRNQPAGKKKPGKVVQRHEEGRANHSGKRDMPNPADQGKVIQPAGKKEGYGNLSKARLKGKPGHGREKKEIRGFRGIHGRLSGKQERIGRKGACNGNPPLLHEQNQAEPLRMNAQDVYLIGGHSSQPW